MRIEVAIAITLGIVLTTIAVWDIWVTASGRPQETVSDLTRRWSQRWPETLIILGALIQHLFGGR